MNNGLQQIQDFIQAFVNAIAAILNVEVTVVDHKMYRVAATAKYPDIGKRISHASFFQNVIVSKKSAIIENSALSEICQQCDDRQSCSECADIAYPIFYHNEVCGVISIAAFTEKERLLFNKNKNKFEQFLKYMSMLIESKMMTLHHSQELEHQLDEVINNSQKSYNQDGFIGENIKIKQILELAHKIRDSDSTVLIYGESGTGKEVLANIIHNQSDRKNKLMITINCAAIPENLVESELFGYEGGAFTGANPKGYIGKFELANNGTLFLDEISEMPLSTQSKLLRVLQERQVMRIGGNKSIPINVRVICASNQDLLKLVKQNKFRMDLFYRINVIPIEIPALRDRVDDIPLLTQSLIHLYNKKFKKRVTLSEPVMNVLISYSWPGNVRELKNLIEYFINVKDNDEINLSDLPGHIVMPVSTIKNHDNEIFHLKNLLFEYEKGILQQLLKHTKTTEDKKLVANKLGIGLSTLYKKMELYHIQ